MKINHSFVSPKPVGTDPNRIYSSIWNADHAITGQADATQLNPNVVQAVVSDANVTGSIASQTLTLSWSGTLSPTRGGFGANVSAQSGVPLFATGVPTFIGTTGSGNFVQATSPTITTPTISTSATIAAGADNTSFETITGAGGNERYIASTDAGGNVHLRSQNSLTLSLGVNTSDVFTVGATGATLIQALTYGGVTLSNAVTGTGPMVLGTSPSLTTPVIGSGGLTMTGTTSGTQVLRGPSAASGTITTPAGTYSLVGDTLTQTLSSKTLSGPIVTSAGVTINGATSGTTVLAASATASGTLTLPAATDTLVGKATTDTLSNKTLVSPALGTPASGTLTNCTGLPLAGLATQAAYTIVGNFTGSAAVPTASAIGGLTQKVSPASTDLVLIQDQAASGQLKYASVSSLASAGSVASIDSKTGAFTTGNGLDSTAGNILEITAARRTLPTRQTFTSGSGTYTTPANCLWIEVEMVGGGGGSGGSGSTATSAGGGGTSTFGTSFLSAGGGNGAGTANGTPAPGGIATGGDINISGANGQAPAGGAVQQPGGLGGSTPLGMHGAPAIGLNPGNAATGYGGGGSGAGGSSAGSTNTGGGGAAGGYLRKIINTPSATYAYAVGAAGTAAAAGTGGQAGAAGAPGIIIVIEHYGS